MKSTTIEIIGNSIFKISKKQRTYESSLTRRMISGKSNSLILNVSKVVGRRFLKFAGKTCQTHLKESLTPLGPI
jgi:hypothetical protein